MENVLFVTHMCALVHWFEYVMSVIMDLTKEDVLYVVDLEFLMHIIVKNALCRKKMWVDLNTI